MQNPKRTKYRKYQKGSIGGIQSNTTELIFGKFGLKSLDVGRLSAKNIETIRRLITRKFKRTGQVWARIFPDIPVTAKPSEVRMGKGKGAPSYWISRVVPGQVLFEMDGIPFSLAQAAAELVSEKLAIKTRLVIVDKVKKF